MNRVIRIAEEETACKYPVAANLTLKYFNVFVVFNFPDYPQKILNRKTLVNSSFKGFLKILRIFIYILK